MSTISASSNIKGRKAAWVTTVVLQSLYLLSLPVWYFISMFSVMLFDAPGSENNWVILMFYYAIKSYPFIVLGAAILTWVIYKKGIYKWTYLLNVAPALIMILCTGLMAVYSS
ncbi:hypothetical protein D3C76_88220 [compost metagenome]